MQKFKETEFQIHTCINELITCSKIYLLVKLKLMILLHDRLGGISDYCLISWRLFIEEVHLDDRCLGIYLSVLKLI